MLKEFQQFIMRGNVLDLAVGVIIGGAFGKIIDSIVSQLITPIIGVLMGGIDVSKAVVSIGGVLFGIGDVLQNVINFIITGFVLFMILKAYNSAMKSKQVNYAPEPTPTEASLADIKALMEKIEANTRRYL